MSGAPDFIGVGTHLAGTSWWADLLGEHPLVHRPADGEWAQDFFVPFCARPMGDADVAAYHARFARTGPGIVGEWSQRYLYDAWTLPLIRRAAPEAKLLVLLRDPLERYRSALRIRLGEERQHGKWIEMADFVHRARYATQLRILYAFFPPEQVLVLQYEQCRTQPLAQYQRTLAFLGLEASDPPAAVRRLQRRQVGLVRRLRPDRARSTPTDVRLWPDLLASLRTALEDEIGELAEIAPEIDQRLWTGFEPTSD